MYGVGALIMVAAQPTNVNSSQPTNLIRLGNTGAGCVSSVLGAGIGNEY